jgi:hypothetical protein
MYKLCKHYMKNSLFNKYDDFFRSLIFLYTADSELNGGNLN